nr:hypothetical protein ISGA_5456 [Gordonia sp. NB41Y]
MAESVRQIAASTAQPQDMLREVARSGHRLRDQAAALQKTIDTRALAAQLDAASADVRKASNAIHVFTGDATAFADRLARNSGAGALSVTAHALGDIAAGALFATVAMAGALQPYWDVVSTMADMNAGDRGAATELIQKKAAGDILDAAPDNDPPRRRRIP